MCWTSMRRDRGWHSQSQGQPRPEGSEFVQDSVEMDIDS